jgi:hypothetical protein
MLIDAFSPARVAAGCHRRPAKRQNRLAAKDNDDDDDNDNDNNDDGK